jgi:5-methylcytosine-specific restriction endonuclease McrA
MTKIRQKKPRLKLNPASYRKLHREVLRRDGWRCQICGTMERLEVHHRKFRSKAGDDSEENLITLCFECHARIHRLGFDSIVVG